MKKFEKNLLLVLLLGFIPFLGISQTIGKTNFLIVKNAFFNRSNILKPNAALLIIDESEIKKNERIFFDNNTFGHACGFHYDIQFWKNSETLIKDISFNEECEEFLQNNNKIQAVMKSYIKLLETKPTHYIYNLRISAKIEPRSMQEAFKDSGFHLFFIDGVSQRYTSLTFRYMQISKIKELVDRTKWQAEQDENENKAIKKMELIIDSIKSIKAVIEQSKISFPMQGFGGGQIEHEAEVTLKFKNGTDLEQIKTLIEKNGGSVQNSYTPDYYSVQLLDTSDNIEPVKVKMKGYDIVIGVYEYPNMK